MMGTDSKGGLVYLNLNYTDPCPNPSCSGQIHMGYINNVGRFLQCNRCKDSYRVPDDPNTAPTTYTNTVDKTTRYKAERADKLKTRKPTTFLGGVPLGEDEARTNVTAPSSLPKHSIGKAPAKRVPIVTDYDCYGISDGYGGCYCC